MRKSRKALLAVAAAVLLCAAVGLAAGWPWAGGGEPAPVPRSMVLETGWGSADGEPDGVFPSREALAASGVGSSPYAFDNRRGDGLPDELDSYDEGFFGACDLAVVSFSNIDRPGTAYVSGVSVEAGEAVVEVRYEASPPWTGKAAIQRDYQAFAPVPKGEAATARVELVAVRDDGPLGWLFDPM